MTSMLLNMKPDKKLRKYDEKALSEAQKRLIELCTAYGLEPWSINARNAPWRDLCLLLIGLDPGRSKGRKRGRPAHSEDKISLIGGRAFSLSIFAPLDKKTGKRKRKPTLKEIDASVATVMGIEEKIYESGRLRKPSEVVRGFRNRYKKQLLKNAEDLGKNFDPGDDYGMVCEDPLNDPDFKSVKRKRTKSKN